MELESSATVLTPPRMCKHAERVDDSDNLIGFSDLGARQN